MRERTYRLFSFETNEGSPRTILIDVDVIDEGNGDDAPHDWLVLGTYDFHSVTDLGTVTVEGDAVGSMGSDYTEG